MAATAILRRRTGGQNEEEEKPLKEEKKAEEEEVESHLRPSLLSSEAFSNTENGYKGFVNLALLLLGLVNFRLVVENLIKYGLLFIESSDEITVDWHAWPGLTITVLNSGFALTVLFIEKAAFRKSLSASAAFYLEVVFVAAIMILPAYAVVHFALALGSGILTMLWSTIIWMKMVSFFHVNSTLRSSLLVSSGSAAASRPSSPSRNNQVSGSNPTEHLTLVSLLRFFIIPSLVYEVHWAQTTRVRWAWLTRRIAEAVFLSMFIYVVSIQYI